MLLVRMDLKGIFAHLVILAISYIKVNVYKIVLLLHTKILKIKLAYHVHMGVQSVWMENYVLVVFQAFLIWLQTFHA